MMMMRIKIICVILLAVMAVFTTRLIIKQWRELFVMVHSYCNCENTRQCYYCKASECDCRACIEGEDNDSKERRT